MTKQLPLRFGILGAAKIAPNALTLPAGQVPGVEVTAIAARDPARAREFAKANGIPRVLATYEELIADPEIEVIYNPLPNSLHCEWSIRAMRAGKHVFCEKPIASNAAEADRMALVADNTGLLLLEDFTTIIHSPIVRGVIEWRYRQAPACRGKWCRFRRPIFVLKPRAARRWTSDATRCT
jgi:predicted dehydrogenase